MPEFVKNAGELAKAAMEKINPGLVLPYRLVIEFLIDNPDMASSGRSKSSGVIGTKEYIESQAEQFSRSRNPKIPVPPQTIPDEMVSLILNQYFGLPEQKLADAKKWHSLSMAAENIIGDVLERYVASVLEKEGWAWCSGSMVKAVDFVYRDKDRGWVSLQVKNRDNSENSSSAAIRTGTKIQKWHRSFSKKAGDNWSSFPFPNKLSESSFRTFVEKYIKELKGQ